MVQIRQSELPFHCQDTLTVLLCGFATLCHYVSVTAFNISLVPQIHKNAYLKSTNGLSPFWAAALFSAAFVHSFFIFHITDRIIYFKISAVLYGLSAFLVLVQFWMYSNQTAQFKVTFFGIFTVIWTALFSVELAAPQPEASAKLEWVAIAFFSIDLLPQVMLNIMESSTLGQSNIAVVLMTVGKSSQFISMQILDTSTKFKSMTYIGAFLGHFNCLQLVLYRKPQAKKNKVPNYGTESGTEYSVDEGHGTSDPHDKVYSVKQSDEQESRMGIFAWTGLLKRMAAWQILVALFEIGALITLTSVTTAYIDFQWILFAPCVLFMILFGTALYRDYSGESWKCWENAIQTVQYKLFSETAI